VLARQRATRILSDSSSHVPAVVRCFMPTFYLEPVEGQTSHPRWTSTSLSEGCWVVAPNAFEARRRVAIATTKTGDVVSAQEYTPSPWLNAYLTDCRLDNSPVSVPEDTIVSVTGKTIEQLPDANVRPRAGMRGPTVMSKRDEYLANAADCHRKAIDSTGEDDKRNWLRLAQSWLGLIQTIEARPPGDRRASGGRHEDLP
jgi:hypothetical protein